MQGELLSQMATSKSLEDFKTLSSMSLIASIARTFLTWIEPIEKEIKELETFFEEYSNMLNNPKRRAYYYREDDYMGYKAEFRRRLKEEEHN